MTACILTCALLLCASIVTTATSVRACHGHPLADNDLAYVWAGEACGHRDVMVCGGTQNTAQCAVLPTNFGDVEILA